MSYVNALRGGRALVAGLLGLTASVALAAPGHPLVVSPQQEETRAVPVRIADLDLASPYAQRTLELRVDAAAREVCDIHAGSRLDQLPSAKACLAQARAGALAQLEARGLPVPSRSTAGGLQ